MTYHLGGAPLFWELVDRLAVPCDDLEEWAATQAAGEHRLWRTEIGTAWVSTVFTGIAAYSFGEGAPLLFETMAFGNDDTTDVLVQTRCCTYAEAKVMHADAVAQVVKLVRGADAMMAGLTGGAYNGR